MLPASAVLRMLALAGALQDPDPVRAAADEAAVLMKEGRYDEAMATLDEAERVERDPVFVYMRGVIEEKRGDCAAAIEHYDRYLALDVPEVDAAEARRRRDACREQLPPPAPRTPPPAATVDAVPRARLKPRPWYADPAGVTLTVVGVVGIGVGAGLYTQARADARAAGEASTLGAYDERATRAERLSRAGIVTMSVAGAIVVAAIVRYAIVGARARKERRQGAWLHQHYFGTLGP